MRKSFKLTQIREFLLLIIIFLHQISFAQNEGISYGVKGGINFSKITESNFNQKTESRLGFQLGGIVDFTLTKRFHIQTELFYSETGAKSSINLNADPDTGFSFFTRNVDIHLKYINLPVLAKYYVTNQFSFEIGPQIGYLLSGKLVYEQDIFTNNASEEQRTVSLTNYEKYDVSIKLGLTYKHRTGFFLNMNYNYGLINLITNDVIIPLGQIEGLLLGENEVLKNRGLFLSIGYFLN